MPVRYDPPLVSGLAREIERRWKDERVRSLRLAPAEREARLLFRSGRSLALLLDPGAGHVLTGGAGVATAGTDHPLRGLRLASARALPDERVLRIDLGASPPEPAFRLFVEFQTNRWNAVLVRVRTGRAEAVLRSRIAGGRTLRRGATYTPPASRRAWVSAPPSLDEWRRFLDPHLPAERSGALLAGAAWISSINVEWVIGEAAASPSDTALEEAYDRYLRLRSGSGAAWLLKRSWGWQPYVLGLGEDAQPAASLLEAMHDAARREHAGGEASPAGEADPELQAALRARRERIRRRKEALERQLAGPLPEELRAAGRLLLARKDDIRRGARRAALTGFDGAPAEIELDPALGVVENAERYFRLARRRERALRNLPPRIRELEEGVAEVEAALERLERGDLTGDSLRAARDLVPSRAAPSGHRARDTEGKRDSGHPSPYRRLRTRSGREIRVGRSARANDELTFRHSAPDDIWLHARQARGAHVILRWGRRDENPPQADLEDAAVAAAVFSEARHSGIVPVEWTRRKYVRKPRRSPPGSVIPDRTATLFVPPDAGRVRRMRGEP